MDGVGQTPPASGVPARAAGGGVGGAAVHAGGSDHGRAGGPVIGRGAALSQGLVEGDAGAGGEVQAALVGGLGDAEGAVGVGGEEGVGEAVGFAAEDEAVVGGKFRIPEAARGFGG